MRMSKLSRPSPAMIVACVALSLALAGSAVAGTEALNKAVTKSKVKQIAKKQGKKQAKKQINKKASGLSVANADTVDGFHADDLVRSAFSQIDNDALVGPSGPATVRSTTIDAPTTGFLLVNAGSDVFGGPTTGRCGIRINGTLVLSSEREWQLAAGNSEEDCTTETTAQVPAGTHTVDLFAVNGVAAGARYDEAELQVLFVPFGSTGTQPASAAKASGGGDRDGN
jgi:hypothetical protein